MELVFKEESFAIMGACFEVYKEMGCGSVEPVYQECLALELAMQDIPSSSGGSPRAALVGQRAPRRPCLDRLRTCC
jgi:GxxExxY protein